MVDAGTEGVIQEAVRQLTVGRTTFISAHRSLPFGTQTKYVSPTMERSGSRERMKNSSVRKAGTLRSGPASQARMRRSRRSGMCIDELFEWSCDKNRNPSTCMSGPHHRLLRQSETLECLNDNCRLRGQQCCGQESYRLPARSMLCVSLFQYLRPLLRIRAEHDEQCSDRCLNATSRSDWDPDRSLV